MKRTITLVLLGNSDTGKTSAAQMYIDNTYSSEYKATIVMDECKPILLENGAIQLKIFDLAGQEKFRSMAESYYQFGKCFLIFVNLCKKDALNNLLGYVSKIKANSSEAEIQVIASKDDLRHEWVVSKEKFEEFCQSNDLLNYTYVSAKENKNIKEAFEEPVMRCQQKFISQLTLANLEVKLTDEESKQLDAFKLIYTAIKEGESPVQFYKNNFVKKLERSGKSKREQLEEIKVYAKEKPTSRTHAAWVLASNPSYYNNLDLKNKELVTAIYKEAFKRGRGITQSKITFNSIFSNKTLEKSLASGIDSIMIEARSSNGEGRLGRICRSLILK